MSGWRPVAAIAVCLLYGCGSTLGTRSPRWLGGTSRKAAEEQSARQEEDEKEKPNPLKKSPEKNPDRVETSSASEAKTSGSKQDPKVVSHDAETVKLIDEELQHVPPEQRDQLRRDLGSLDASMVQFVLRNMRMVRQLGQSGNSQVALAGGAAPAGGAAAASISPGGAVMQAGGPGSSTSAAPGTLLAQQSPAAFAADAGLGSADPWNKYATNGTDPYQSQHSGGPIGSTSAPGSRPPVGGDPNSPGILVTPGQTKTGTVSPSTPAVITPAGQQPSFGHSLLAPGQQPTANPVPAAVSGQPVASQNAAAQVPDLPVTMQTPTPPVAPQQPQPPAATATSTPPNPADPTAVAVAGAVDPTQTASRTMSKEFGVPEYPAAGDAAKALWRENMERLISMAETQAAQTGAGTTPEEKQLYIQKHVHLRMLYMMGGFQERALEAIPGIEAADQEFWQQVFWGLSNYFDSGVMPQRDDRATQTIAQLRSAVQRLQENAKLQLANVTFCHKITSFGSYERFPQDEFRPSQPVLVYSEVNNFKSEPTADGQYRTILRSTVEIFRAGPNGELVERFEFPATEDLCRNFRRDYFHSYEFSIPERISLGPHVLRLTVEDQLSQKVATSALNFTVK